MSETVEIWARRPDEHIDAYKGFLMYVEVDKSVSKVSANLGRTTRTIYRWKKKYNWDRRAAAYEKSAVGKIIPREAKFELTKQENKSKPYIIQIIESEMDMYFIYKEAAKAITEQIKDGDGHLLTRQEMQLLKLLQDQAGILARWLVAMKSEQTGERSEVDLSACTDEEVEFMLKIHEKIA